jgi:hypothetical protein
VEKKEMVTLVGYSGWIALTKEQCGNVDPLLGNNHETSNYITTTAK